MKYAAPVIRFAYMTLICLSLAACVKSSSDNDTPNLIEGLMTEAQIQLNQQLWGVSYNGNWGALMVQHWSNPVREDLTTYNVNGLTFDEFWFVMFAQVLNPLREVKRLADESSDAQDVKNNKKAIADILTVYAFHNLTDGFGDMPVFGFLENTFSTQPPYDEQQEIYETLLLLLDQALSQMNESESSYTSGDIIYNGNVRKWKQFGYSLMLRMGMRMADVNENSARQYISKAVGQTMLSNSDNAIFVFSGAPSIANPFYVELNLDGRDNFYVTDQFIDYLKNTNDPRLSQMIATNQAGEFDGIPYGEMGLNGPDFSRPNESIRRIDAPAIMMDYAEVQFLLAEAYQRNIVTGSASNAYARGIEASMNFWGITDPATISAYIDANPYDAANWQESLGTQKWIAFFANGPQAWAEWRRLDFPQLTPPTNSTSPVIPVRLPYPNSEVLDNATQLNSVTNDPNDLTTKMWWDVN